MANSRCETLIEGTFSMFPRNKSSYKVEVNRRGLSYTDVNTKSSTTQYLHFGDVTGCHCRRSKAVSDSASCYFTIYAYPIQKKTLSGKRTRQRIILTFGVHESSNFEENLKICHKWKNVIVNLARNIKVEKQDVDKCQPPPPRKLLVLINPRSGPGKARQIFENGVATMLEEAEISYKKVVTDHAGHGREIVRKLHLSDWYGIVIVSGDGLIYEVFNGLMSRPDWEQAVNFPVGCIPGGSGNALSLNINYTGGEPIDLDPVLHATFVLIKHRIIPMDLVLIQTPTEQVYSFLSVTWGFIADIDFESEKLRMLGATRFTLYFLKRLVSLRKYKAKVSFLPLTDYDPNHRQQKRKNSTTFSKPRRFTILSSSSTQADLNSSVCKNGCPGMYRSLSCDTSGSKQRIRSKSMPSMKGVSESLNGYENARFESVEEERTLSDFDDVYEDEAENVTVDLKLSDENDNGKEAINSNHVVNNVNGGDHLSTTSDDPFDETVVYVENDKDPIPSPLLSPLSSPVPSNWVTIEDEFITASALYLPYLGPDNLASPDSRLNDGCIHLLLIRGDITKSALLNLFLEIESGKHVNSPNVEVIKVLAFRIEPLSDTGNIMVDGERVDYGPIQGQVLPGLAKVMAFQ